MQKKGRGKLKKRRESWKKNEKTKQRNALWITVVIHNDFGVGEQ